MAKKFGVSIVFGDSNVSLYERVFEQGDELDENETSELKNSVTYKEFDTEAELNAYLEGVNDAAGWLESHVLTDEEVDDIEKM